MVDLPTLLYVEPVKADILVAQSTTQSLVYQHLSYWSTPIQLGSPIPMVYQHLSYWRSINWMPIPPFATWQRPLFLAAPPQTIPKSFQCIGLSEPGYRVAWRDDHHGNCHGNCWGIDQLGDLWGFNGISGDL